MHDLISRQAAIDTLATGEELLKRVLDDMDVVGNEREKYEWGLGLIESYIADMKDLPSAQPQRWIPVSERLPEDGKDCLVTEVITNGMKSVLIAKFANDLYKIDKYDFARRKGEHGWFCYDYEHGRCYDVDVLAWMPLPDPYKEEE